MNGTYIGQSKYRNSSLFHNTLFEQSLRKSFWQTLTFLSILTDHDLFWCDVEQDWAYAVFAVVLYLNFAFVTGLWGVGGSQQIKVHSTPPGLNYLYLLIYYLFIYLSVRLFVICSLLSQLTVFSFNFHLCPKRLKFSLSSNCACFAYQFWSAGEIPTSFPELTPFFIVSTTLEFAAFGSGPEAKYRRASAFCFFFPQPCVLQRSKHILTGKKPSCLSRSSCNR